MFPNVFQAPGDPAVTQTQPTTSPAAGASFHTMSPALEVPVVGMAASRPWVAPPGSRLASLEAPRTAWEPWHSTISSTVTTLAAQRPNIPSLTCSVPPACGVKLRDMTCLPRPAFGREQEFRKPRLPPRNRRKEETGVGQLDRRPQRHLASRQVGRDHHILLDVTFASGGPLELAHQAVRELADGRSSPGRRGGSGEAPAVIPALEGAVHREVAAADVIHADAQEIPHRDCRGRIGDKPNGSQLVAKAPGRPHNSKTIRGQF